MVSVKACHTDPACVMVTQHFHLLSSYSIFLKESISFLLFTMQQKGCSHENLLLHFQIKAMPCEWCSCQYLVGAQDRLFITICRLNSFCGQGLCAAQHKPEGQAVCAAQHGLRQLRLTALWITNSSVYDGLLVWITTFYPLIHKQLAFPTDAVSFRLYH